jgi:hypothetical protein
MTQQMETVNKRVTQMVEVLMEYRIRVTETVKTGEESAIVT